jgi:hypothetical protein
MTEYLQLIRINEMMHQRLANRRVRFVSGPNSAENERKLYELIVERSGELKRSEIKEILSFSDNQMDNHSRSLHEAGKVGTERVGNVHYYVALQ